MPWSRPTHALLALAGSRGRYWLEVVNTRTGGLIARRELVADGLGDRIDCATDITNYPSPPSTSHAFRPSVNTNRAGLLLANNKVFVAFSGNINESSVNDYHGAIIGLDVTDPANPTVLPRSACTTPDDSGGGVWMAGGGLASHKEFAYFTSENGTYDHGAPATPSCSNYQDSFGRLAMDMTLSGYTDTRTTGTSSTSSPTSTGAVIGTPADLYYPQLDPEPRTAPNLLPGYDVLLPPGGTIFRGRENTDADLARAESP